MIWLVDSEGALFVKDIVQYNALTAAEADAFFATFYVTIAIDESNRRKGKN